MFVTLDWKILPMTNTLAYYKNLLFLSIKSFITLGPGLMFASNSGAFPTEVGAPLQGRLLALHSNIRQGWKGLPGTITLAYEEH